MSDEKIGKVKWFNAKFCYGFIEPPDGGADVFLHITALHAAGLKSSIEEGTKLRYTVGPNPRKPGGLLAASVQAA
jgi:CspA family cold shock protein